MSESVETATSKHVPCISSFQSKANAKKALQKPTSTKNKTYFPFSKPFKLFTVKNQLCSKPEVLHSIQVNNYNWRITETGWHWIISIPKSQVPLGTTRVNKIKREHPGIIYCTHECRWSPELLWAAHTYLLLELRNEKTELSRDRRANSIKRDQGRREKELTLALESHTARLGK